MLPWGLIETLLSNLVNGDDYAELLEHLGKSQAGEPGYIFVDPPSLRTKYGGVWVPCLLNNCLILDSQASSFPSPIPPPSPF